MFGILQSDLKPHLDVKIPANILYPYIGLEVYGPNWDPSLLAYDQPGFKEHFAYWVNLIMNDKVTGAGPYGNWGGALILFTTEVTTYDEADSLMAGDPWAVSGTVLHTTQQWLRGQKLEIPGGA